MRVNLSYERILNSANEPGNWLTYGGNYSAQRYSMLTQITPQNVANLRPVWVYQQAETVKDVLRQIIREELQAFGHRIVFFLMRIAFSAEQARILITNVLKVILQTRGDFDQKAYFNLVDESAKTAKRNIIRNTPQMKSLLEEWETAFEGGGGEGTSR